MLSSIEFPDSMDSTLECIESPGSMPRLVESPLVGLWLAPHPVTNDWLAAATWGRGGPLSRPRGHDTEAEQGTSYYECYPLTLKRVDAAIFAVVRVFGLTVHI